MDINQFTLELIRKKNIEWLEEKIFDWIPLVNEFVSNVIEGKTILLITDYKRKWFGDYVIHKLNNFQDFKPSFLPVFDLVKIVPQLEYAKTDEQFDMIEDMLNITFNENYLFWYIGVETKMSEFALRRDDSFLWIMDTDMHRNFFLKSLDEFLDKKLIDLADVLNETIKAAIFAEVEL